MVEILEVPLASIEVGTDRARDFDPYWAEGLAGIIAAQGLMAPITVRVVDGVTRLIAGRYRLEAARILGWDTIPCILSTAASDDAARLEEVMENLGRAELIALDRCHHLYELKQVWERMYPQAKAGVAGAVAMHKKCATANFATASDAPEIFGFSKAAAEKIGLSARAIRLDVKIWNGLSPASRAALVGTDLATKQTELRALSEEKPTRQAKILDLILGDVHLNILNVAGALAYIDGGSVETPIEKQFQAVRTAFSKLPDAALDMVVSAEADRVLASLKRLGRI